MVLQTRLLASSETLLRIVPRGKKQQDIKVMEPRSGGQAAVKKVTTTKLTRGSIPLSRSSTSSHLPLLNSSKNLNYLLQKGGPWKGNHQVTLSKETRQSNKHPFNKDLTIQQLSNVPGAASA
jgi:hypothetical protein